MIHIINSKNSSVRKAAPIHIIKNAQNSNFGTLSYSNYPEGGNLLANRSQNDLRNSLQKSSSLKQAHKLMPTHNIQSFANKMVDKDVPTLKNSATRKSKPGFTKLKCKNHKSSSVEPGAVLEKPVLISRMKQSSPYTIGQPYGQVSDKPSFRDRSNSLSKLESNGLSALFEQVAAGIAGRDERSGQQKRGNQSTQNRSSSYVSLASKF